ncbi:MAG: DUF120 domain-containing protein [Methanomicrobiales archaeon]|nr:DUF120 domain-containing protein [Methanomicrobiales archaeon]
MLPEELQCLKTIALMGGCCGPVWISSQSLASSLLTSPQTVSRRLKSLEDQRMIIRGIRSDGQQVTITRGGEGVLHREFSDYNRIFTRDEPTVLVLHGSVICGLGEGRYYMSLPHYKRQFSEVLGYVPFPGTLNLRLDPPSVDIRKKLDALTWISIQGFTGENRTFGEARCLLCQIGEIPGAIVVPGRSHYPEDIIEVIAEVELRGMPGIDEKDVAVEVRS